MSAMPAVATILPFPRIAPPPGLDYVGLLRLTCAFDAVADSRVEVLDDEDGALARFLCRAPREAFPSREEFVAAALKRYLACIADRRLAEMIYVASLFQSGTSERLPLPALPARLEAAFGGAPPARWRAHLEGPRVLDVALLDPAARDRLELVARGASWWVYGLVEG